MWTTVLAPSGGALGLRGAALTILAGAIESAQDVPALRQSDDSRGRDDHLNPLGANIPDAHHPTHGAQVYCSA